MKTISTPYDNFLVVSYLSNKSSPNEELALTLAWAEKG